MLAPLGLTLLSQSEFFVRHGTDEAAETGMSFVENAIIKARHACKITNLPAIADDSGLEVDALDGAPGIRSARYAGVSGPGVDAANNAKLLNALQEVPEKERRARFRCAVVFMRWAHDPMPLICQAAWEGRILLAGIGDNGFGYDPLFYLPEQRCSSAQLPSVVKNRLSHRGQALRRLIEELEKELVKKLG